MILEENPTVGVRVGHAYAYCTAFVVMVVMLRLQGPDKFSAFVLQLATINSSSATALLLKGLVLKLETGIVLTSNSLEPNSPGLSFQMYSLLAG